MKNVPRIFALAILWAALSFIPYSSDVKDIEFPCILSGIIGTIIVGRLF
jgi:hypothetical protein